MFDSRAIANRNISRLFAFAGGVRTTVIGRCRCPLTVFARAGLPHFSQLAKQKPPVNPAARPAPTSA